jgi:hypothetical protein
MVLVFLEEFLEILANMLEKITDGGQGKQKYPARKCRVRKKRVNTIVCKFIVSGAFQQG